MAEIDIKDKNNSSVGQLTLPETVFSVSTKQGTVHDSIVNYLANQRQGTHATRPRVLSAVEGKSPISRRVPAVQGREAAVLHSGKVGNGIRPSLAIIRTASQKGEEGGAVGALSAVCR